MVAPAAAAPPSSPGSEEDGKAAAQHRGQDTQPQCPSHTLLSLLILLSPFP